MKAFITFFLMIGLSSCAFISGLKDKPTPIPEDAKKVQAAAAPSNAAAGEKVEEKATEQSASAMSPMTH